MHGLFPSLSVRPDAAAAPVTRGADGLTTEAAGRLRDRFGPNSLRVTGPSAARTAIVKLLAPVPLMLEAAMVLEVVLGRYVESGIIAALLAFNAALGYFQEGRAQATLAALTSRLALSAPVRRDGRWQVLPVADLVPNDIVKLSLGGVVPADVVLLTGNVLLDQSMLTGESLGTEAAVGSLGYAGALVQRGEAVARITATGGRTRFGRTAELVRTAHVPSSQQQAVLRMVRNLAVFNGLLIAILIAYGLTHHMPVAEIVPLVLTAILASIPVALPATFTLASALGARALARNGVLPTRLSAVDEAGTMDVLCVDKTGTLTRNHLSVTAVRALPGCDEARVLAMAALASSEGGLDPVDSAIRSAASAHVATNLLMLLNFIPFDPGKKMAEATVMDPTLGQLRIVKGAYATISALAAPSPLAKAAAAELEVRGLRVLAVGLGTASAMRLLGLIALSDPPRDDSAALISELKALGIRTVMVTGDAPATAMSVARAVGLDGAICPAGPLPEDLTPERFALYAGVLPEDKYTLVKAFQRSGHAIGMCGDGANDAPALRQAHIGIAMSSATDAAKSAAGMVLIEPGLVGIVAAVTEGRVTFQRIMTYALNSMTKKIVQVLFLCAGILMTGHAILTPVLMIIVMLAGDLLGMSLTADNVRPSPTPNTWRIGSLTLAGMVTGASELIFCVAVVAIGHYRLGLTVLELQTLAFVTLVCGNQATTYTVRARGRIWAAPHPSRWLLASSAIDVAIASILAGFGVLMAPLPFTTLCGVLLAACGFAFAMDAVKAPTFARLGIT